MYKWRHSRSSLQEISLRSTRSSSIIFLLYFLSTEALFIVLHWRHSQLNRTRFERNRKIVYRLFIFFVFFFPTIQSCDPRLPPSFLQHFQSMAGWLYVIGYTSRTAVCCRNGRRRRRRKKKRKNQRERRYIERCSVPKSISSFRLAFPLSFVFFLSLFTTADVERVLSLYLSYVVSCCCCWYTSFRFVCRCGVGIWMWILRLRHTTGAKCHGVAFHQHVPPPTPKRLLPHPHGASHLLYVQTIEMCPVEESTKTTTTTHIYRRLPS